MPLLLRMSLAEVPPPITDTNPIFDIIGNTTAAGKTPLVSGQGLIFLVCPEQLVCWDVLLCPGCVAVQAPYALAC